VIEILHLSTAGFAVVFVSAFLGALIQGSIGYGLNLVVVPVVAIIQPAALPAAMIVMALPMTASSAFFERGHIHHSGVMWMTIGRLPGVILGTWIVVALESSILAIAIGGFVILAAAMSVVTSRIPVTSFSSAVAGFVAGVMGTASAIGGPPVALLYQHEHGPVLRATLGATFLIGTAMSLGALGLAGRVEVWHWALGLALTPGIAMGFYASLRIHDWLDAGWLRPCVLAFAAFSGFSVLLRGLF